LSEPAKTRKFVIDDEELIRYAVDAGLEFLGDYGVHFAEDGITAIKMLKEFSPQLVLVDLVLPAASSMDVLEVPRERKLDFLLLDLMMPKVDGYEVLKELRTGTYERPGKIIVMNAHAQLAELDGLMALGADAFMPKPFTLTDLEKILA